MVSIQLNANAATVMVDRIELMHVQQKVQHMDGMIQIAVVIFAMTKHQESILAICLAQLMDLIQFNAVAHFVMENQTALQHVMHQVQLMLGMIPFASVI